MEVQERIQNIEPSMIKETLSLPLSLDTNSIPHQ